MTHAGGWPAPKVRIIGNGVVPSKPLPCCSCSSTQPQAGPSRSQPVRRSAPGDRRMHTKKSPWDCGAGTGQPGAGWALAGQWCVVGHERDRGGRQVSASASRPPLAMPKISPADGRRRYDIPIPPVRVWMLRAHIASYGNGPGGWLFRTARRALNDTGYGEVWHCALHPRTQPSLVGIPLGGHPHDLRHGTSLCGVTSARPPPRSPAARLRRRHPAQGLRQLNRRPSGPR